MSLLGAAEIRELAAALDLKPSKSLGQNFVHDGNVCRKIVRTAGLTATDVALEIGPGLGSLTLAMMQEAKAVVVVEIDKQNMIRACWVCSVTMICVLILLFLFWAYCYTHLLKS